jgi:hypothetical protein
MYTINISFDEINDPVLYLVYDRELQGQENRDV